MRRLRTLTAWIAVTALTAGLLPSAVQAQALPDPTRPMGAPRRPAESTGNSSTHSSPAPVARLGVVNATTARAPAPARPAPPPQLQALMTPHDGPRSALLDGQLLLTGETLGRDWRLERIGDDGVLLRRVDVNGSANGSATGSAPGSATSPDSATLWLPLLAAPRLHKEP